VSNAPTPLFRMNPCNLNYYLPLLLSGGTAGTTSSLSWLQLDDNFRRSLPDEWYSKRLIYRGMVMMACDGIVQVDGIAVSEAEREKARQLIEGGTRDR
jgi:protein NUD1